MEDNRIYVPAADGKVAFIDARDIGEVAAVCLSETGHEMAGYHLTDDHLDLWELPPIA